MEKLEIRDESELGTVAQMVLRRLAEKTPQTAAAVVALSGDLGAGKTAFTKALARELGVQEEVTSPTFVILKIFKCENGPYETLVHMDAYRIEDQEELRPLHFDQFLEDSTVLLCIEWAEKVQERLPGHAVSVHIEIQEGDIRAITIT